MTNRSARFRPGRLVPLLLAGALAACETTEPPPPPGPPTAFTVLVTSNQQVTLSWVLAGDDADEVRIERAAAGGAFAPLTTLPAALGASTQHVDGNLTPATAYQYRIQACNESGCSAFTGPAAGTTFATLAIVTTTLPNALRGQPYSAGLNATGGDGVHTWFVDAGSLPAGLSLSNVGIISGTPGTEQVARFTARVRSGDGQTAVREFTITVTGPAQGGLAIRTVALAPALAGLLYQPALATTGGDGTAVTVTWSLASGVLPAGLTLTSAGVFSGRPTQIGSFPLTVRATSASGQSATRSYTLVVAAENLGRFNITRVDVSTVSPAIGQHVAAAIEKWESALAGDLTREEIPRGFFQPGACPFADITNGTFVDDVVILVNIASIDGPGSILGQASPCAIRDDILTIVGVLTLDADDLTARVGTQTLTDILFHEMGHILGSGTLWAGFDCPPDPGFTACWSHLTGAGTDDPRFTGPNAVREWLALGGTGAVPVENQGGEGTRDSHWRESVFKTEIMTGFVSPSGVPNPLSRVTLGSMADLGYVVNYGVADGFALTAPGASLRTSLDAGWEQVNLHPVLVKRPDGSRRIISPRTRP